MAGPKRGGRGGGGCTQSVHGRSRMPTDPRILTMPGRRVLTSQADIACTKPGGGGRGGGGRSNNEHERHQEQH